ncbi:MAG: regulatory iron-sulfur-containing complex subunit RicT [Bacteroidota bacterium]
MGCAGCTTDNGSPKGCKSNGGCSTGGCNRLNTYDWLATMDIYEPQGCEIVEVSFKNGARKNFYHNPPDSRAITGDFVVVDTGSGYDIGAISLSGELVRMQMKKKKVDEKSILQNVVRKANDRDMERMQEARRQEKPTMIRARAIARTLGLEMKIGDVEYQGDKRKATFYYTADGRVDFRELIRHFAKEFRVKIEMRQIGARQESARIGGIGSCGRELCCSTWLTDFKSVSTAAARYQNLAINQSKLSGQCGRLKCCLNYELDTYMDALEQFPKNVDRLKTEAGTAVLVKTDIFKGTLYYAYDGPNGRGKFYPLSIERVREIKNLNVKGEVPTELLDKASLLAVEAAAEEMMDYEDVTGFIELPPEERRRRKKRRGGRNRKKKPGSGNSPNAKTNNKGEQKQKSEQKGEQKRGKNVPKRGERKENSNTSPKAEAKGEKSSNNSRRRGRGRGRGRGKSGGNQQGNNNNNKRNDNNKKKE